MLAKLWRELSQDEPENQPPPETLEQRTALLAREAARRLVHVVNAVAALPVAASSKFSQLLIEILHVSRHLYGYIHFNRAMRWQGYLDFDEIWYGGSFQLNKNPF